MNVLNHSPAPWNARLSEDNADAREIVAEFCESPIAEVPRWLDEIGNDSEVATANLNAMTDAPELTAACRMVEERWESGDLAEAARCCQAALERASGKAAAELPEIDIHELLTSRRQIAAIWGIEDVQQHRPDLDDDQAWQVLQAVRHGHDCNYGMTWETLEYHADLLFPEPAAE